MAAFALLTIITWQNSRNIFIITHVGAQLSAWLQVLLAVLVTNITHFDKCPSLLQNGVVSVGDNTVCCDVLSCAQICVAIITHLLSCPFLPCVHDFSLFCSRIANNPAQIFNNAHQRWCYVSVIFVVLCFCHFCCRIANNPAQIFNYAHPRWCAMFL